MNDGADREIEVGGTERIAFEGAIADFPTFMEDDGMFELTGSLAIVEACLAMSVQCWGGYHLVINKLCSMQPSTRSVLANSDFDAADNLLRRTDGATVRDVMSNATRAEHANTAKTLPQARRDRPAVSRFRYRCFFGSAARIFQRLDGR